MSYKVVGWVIVGALLIGGCGGSDSEPTLGAPGSGGTSSAGGHDPNNRGGAEAIAIGGSVVLGGALALGGSGPVVFGGLGGALGTAGAAAGGRGSAGAFGNSGTSGGTVTGSQARADCAWFIADHYCPAVVACEPPGTVDNASCVAAVQRNLDCERVIAESPALSTCETQLAATPCTTLIAADGSIHIPASCAGVFTLAGVGGAGGSGGSSPSGGTGLVGGTPGSAGEPGVGGRTGTGGYSGTGGAAPATGGQIGQGGSRGASGSGGLWVPPEGTVLATDSSDFLIQTSTGPQLFSGLGCYMYAGQRVVFSNSTAACSMNELTVVGTMTTCTVTCLGNRYSGVVTASVGDDTFLISTTWGEQLFSAQTYCFNVQAGDSVLFVSSTGACASNSFVDLRTQDFCGVWCE
jgi:hypothetical protein